MNASFFFLVWARVELSLYVSLSLKSCLSLLLFSLSKTIKSSLFLSLLFYLCFVWAMMLCFYWGCFREREREIDTEWEANKNFNSKRGSSLDNAIIISFLFILFFTQLLENQKRKNRNSVWLLSWVTLYQTRT